MDLIRGFSLTGAVETSFLNFMFSSWQLLQEWSKYKTNNAHNSDLNIHLNGLAALREYIYNRNNKLFGQIMLNKIYFLSWVW